jgi:hypothetical protein
MSRRRSDIDRDEVGTIEEAARRVGLPFHLVSYAVRIGMIEPSFVEGDRSFYSVAKFWGFKRKITRRWRHLERLDREKAEAQS